MSTTTNKRKEVPPRPPATRHDDDLYTWVREQIALLRAGRLSDIDALNIAEELSDVGREQLDKLESAIAVLTMHLLKWDHQADRRSRSWALTVAEQRRRITKLLKKNPGLKSELEETVADAYADGRDRALIETGLPYDTFPLACPYAFEDMMFREINFDR
jgi:ribosomal protein S15P/S13E